MDAEDLTKRLREKKEKAYILSVWDNHKQLWHSVRTGNYKNYESARKAATQFSAKHRLTIKVIKLGSLEFIPPQFLVKEPQALKAPKKKPKK